MNKYAASIGVLQYDLTNVMCVTMSKKGQY